MWKFDRRVFLCHGFTTFSSFAYENILLLQDKDYLTCAAYGALSFVPVLAATVIGLTLTRG